MRTDPCVRSGWCCKKTPCWEALRARPDIRGGPCPFLEPDGEDQYWCGLVRANADNPDELDRLKASLSIGAGCCANLSDGHINLMVKLGRKDEMSQFGLFMLRNRLT